MDKKALEAAQKELEDFLNEHPQLRGLQNDIDRMLEQVGDDPLKRLRVLSELIRQCLEEELKPNLEKLKDLSQQAIASLKDPDDKAS